MMILTGLDMKIIEVRDIPGYKKTNGFIKLSFLKRCDDQFNFLGH